MKMKKRIISSMLVSFLIVVLAGFAFSITTCAKSTSLTIWSNWPEKGVKDLIKKFEAENPQIKVDYLYIPWNNAVWAQKISTAKLSDSMPDLCETAQLASEWSEPVRGVYTSLNPYIERDKIDVNDFVSPILKANTLSGQVYGLPLWFDFGMLFSNRVMFAEAGFTGPPTTWDDLINYTKKLTVIDNGELKRMGFALLEFPNFFTLQAVAGGHMFSKDGTKATFNSPEMLKTAKLMMELRDIMGGMKELARIASSETLGAEADSFVRYKSAMIYMNVFSEIGRIKKYAPDISYEISPMPSPKGMPLSLIHTAGASLVMPTGAKHPEEAWKFIKFWTSKDNLITFVKDNLETWTVLPGRVSCLSEPGFLSIDSHLSEIAKQISQLQPNGHFVHPLATDAHWINMIKAVEDFLWGRAAPEEALNTANEKAQKFLDETLENLKKRNIEVEISLY